MAGVDLSTVRGLVLNLGILSDIELGLAQMLVSCGQESLFSEWAPSPADDAKKHAFFEQVATLNV